MKKSTKSIADIKVRGRGNSSVFSGPVATVTVRSKNDRITDVKVNDVNFSDILLGLSSVLQFKLLGGTGNNSAANKKTISTKQKIDEFLKWYSSETLDDPNEGCIGRRLGDVPGTSCATNP